MYETLNVSCGLVTVITICTGTARDTPVSLVAAVIRVPAFKPLPDWVDITVHE